MVLIIFCIIFFEIRSIFVFYQFVYQNEDVIEDRSLPSAHLTAQTKTVFVAFVAVAVVT